MPFGIGGSRSRSRSNSSSSSFDNLDASSFDVGFDTSSSSSRGGGTSFDRSGSQSSQRIAFEDMFSGLFSQSFGAAGGIDTGRISGAADLLFGAGGNIIQQLQGGGVGADYLETRLGERDGLAEAQVSQLGDDLARFLAEDVNPAITSGGVQARTMGGSRGEVQRGIAERGASEAFVRGATDIRIADQAARDSIAGGLMTSEADRLGTSLAGLPQMFGMAEAGAMSGLSPFMALAQILGPQMALTDSTSFGEGGSEQFSEALAEAFGYNIGGSRTRGRAGSRSQSSSTSSSRSFSLELPGPTG